MSDEKMSAAARKAHVEALKNELSGLQSRPDSDTKTRRIGEVQAQLKQYGTRPPRGGAPETA
jgi:hypothetical protein